MLRRDEAQERLRAFAADDVRPAKAGFARRLAAGPIADRLERWVVRPSASNAGVLATELDQLSGRQLARAFGVVCPTLGDALARWWVWARAAPYQRGWMRRGFRSSSPADSRTARADALWKLLMLGQRWPQDVDWFAAWLSHLPGHSGALVGLLACEISAGRADVADTLTASAFGQHPISGATRTGLGALLACDRAERWEQVATLLRDAGRQEGLRSSILESADVANPDAFGRILDVVVADDLTRFAGTIRAAGVWLGEELTVRSSGELAASLAELARGLREPSSAAPAVGSSAETFVRLIALAYRDAHQAIPRAAELLRHPDVGPRRAAARLLAELGLRVARDALRPALADPDLAVYATAVSAWPTSPSARDVDATLDRHGAGILLHRVETLGKPRKVETGIIGTRTLEVGAAQAADVILANCSRVWPEALAAASSSGRSDAARRLAADPVANRAVLFALLSDSAPRVRRDAFAGLEQLPQISESEAALMHDALRRKASDRRRQAITLLLRQPPNAIAASVTALQAGTEEQVSAAAELAKRAGLSTGGEERSAGDVFPASLRYRPADRTPAERPSPLQADHFARYHPGCARIVTSLRAWLAEHRDVEVETNDGVSLLANLRWLPAAAPGSPLPLPEILGPWWERTAPTLTDDGVELALLVLAVPPVPLEWAKEAVAQVVGPIRDDPSASRLVWPTIDWLARNEFRECWVDIAIDAATAVRAGLPLSELLGPEETMARLGRTMRYDRWGQAIGRDARSVLVDPARWLPLERLSVDQLGRLWRLARFIDEPAGAFDVFAGPRVRHRTREFSGNTRVELVADQPWRRSPSPELLCRAVDAGTATRADVLHELAPVGDQGQQVESWGRVRALVELSMRRPEPWARSAAVQAVVDEVRDAAIAGEVARGELPAALTPVAEELRSASGIDGVVALLGALGRRPFTRGYSWTKSRESSLSHLVRIHLPGPDDTAERLSAALTAAKIPTRRVIEFGVYAPQWAAMLEAHLAWPGFESAVWWVHAHTKDDTWSVDRQIREEWESSVSQRTPLDSVDLVRGAADVEWFHRVIEELGLDRFTQVLAAAKYASSAGGHKRAELFAAALLGDVDEAELLERIRAKRHQDSVRALGLLPLASRHEPALLARYELLRGFVASDRTSGAQRRASETTAVAIGLENLARAAGYRDPGRLTWAMEAEAVRDLANGPIVACAGDVTVMLSLDADGAPRLGVRRGDRALKAVPAAAAKTPQIAELKSRVTSLRQQARRMRRSLEASCVAGERFDLSEIAELLRHPVLAPMLRDLVLISQEGVAGFACDEPGVLLGPEAEKRELDGSAVRIAHPIDLLAGGEWPQLQHALFVSQRRQPFRQLFRELYVATATETSDGASSRRYAGQQVEARRAAGLFSSRGWVADFETGFARTFHAEKITAWCSLLGGFGTAAEVEDATIDEISFVHAGSWREIPVADVPARLFSEIMRDLDLVVSVAHAGRVDPETSESSTQMRGRLVDETAQLLGLDNVEVTDHHALIRGKLGSYSVQLGSGVVHRVPGNALCIIPVSAQHRGRIFLPFADDDPRTAEVISKVLLLARDDRIQDPTILEQLT